MHASPVRHQRRNQLARLMCILTQTVHLLGSIIDVLHACHIKEDFTGKLTKTRRAIQGYGGVEVYDVYKEP
jgi:hypothetical protein